MSSHASMNLIYRLVFNAATGMYVAVAETAKGRGKAGRSASAAMLAALTALGGLSTATAQNVLPTGGAVASGSASISQTASAMTINQSSNAAILNWQSFSIGAANSVHFNQPSASSIALNRVIGNSASEILGSLSANGKVMLVNQNGILMGSGAQVDTGGFMASTLNIKDSDFLAGRYIFDITNNTGGTAGSIINNGRINTPSGYAVLIAPQVTNNGFIAARQGTVAIGAGNKVSLDMVGDGLISLIVDQAALNAAIVNTGSINADGGTVLLKASSANALFDTVINSTGIIRADSIANVNGRIILDGGSTGTTEVTGEIGGSISVLGGGAVNATATTGAVNLAGGQAATLINWVNIDLSGSTAALNLTNTGAMTQTGALSVTGALTTNTGGTVIQTGALTQTGGGAVTVTGTTNLTNTGAVTQTGGLSLTGALTTNTSKNNTNSNNSTRQAQTIAQLPKIKPISANGSEFRITLSPAPTSTRNSNINRPVESIITVPSCRPGAPRPAAPGQC